MKFILTPLASPDVGREFFAATVEAAMEIAEREAGMWQDYIQFRLAHRVYGHPESDAQDSVGSHKDIEVATLDTESGLARMAQA